MSQRGALVSALRFASMLACMTMACRQPPAPPPMLPPPTIALSAEDLPASTRLELAITDLSEVPSDDKVEVLISGLVVNRGTRPTSWVLVRVRGLDRDGQTLREVQVTPSSERIPADGGTARFSVVFPNDMAVVDYHVEVVGYAR